MGSVERGTEDHARFNFLGSSALQKQPQVHTDSSGGLENSVLPDENKKQLWYHATWTILGSASKTKYKAVFLDPSRPYPAEEPFLFFLRNPSLHHHILMGGLFSVLLSW